MAINVNNLSPALQEMVVTNGHVDLEKLQQVAFSRVMKPELISEATRLLQAELNGGKAFGDVGDCFIVQDRKLQDVKFTMGDNNTVICEDIDTGARTERKYVAKRLIAETEYDSKNQVIREEHDYEGDGKLDKTSAYERDEKGNVVYEKHILNGKETIIYSEYDDKNRLKKQSVSQEGELPLEKEYHPNGKLAKETSYGETSYGVEWVESAEYNEKGNLVSKISGREDQEADDTWNYEKTTYDASGKKLETQYYTEQYIDGKKVTEFDGSYKWQR